MKDHFDGKTATAHILEKQSEAILSHEAHGEEMPDQLAAACESCKETTFLMLLLSIFLIDDQRSLFPILIVVGFGWLIWKMGRRAWQGWAHLERLHRLIEQEKNEIVHNRPQEREELVALYRLKGFEGKLLDDVVDVLMADQDRLLKVMLEEEMGLNLEIHQHPLEQAMGAGLGVFMALGLTLFSFYFCSLIGLIVASFILISVSGAILAHYKKNRIIQTVIWNLSLASLAFGAAYFLCQFIVS